MFARLADDQTAPWIWHNLQHAEFAKRYHEYNSWYWALVFTHEYFVHVLQDETHEEHVMLWGRHDEENNWPDSQMLGKRRFQTMAITPIPFDHEDYDMRTWVKCPKTPREMARNLEDDPRSIANVLEKAFKPENPREGV